MTSKPPRDSGFLAHYQELIGTWTRRLRNREQAEDLAHDAFVRALEARQEHVEQPRAYLHQIARNIAVDKLRREERRAGLEQDAISAESMLGDGPEADMHAIELADAIERALAELPLNCRKVFVWQKLEGLSQAEIAERMGLSRNMVERYMIRTLRHLREQLEPDDVKVLPRRRWPRYAIAVSVLACAFGLGLFSALRDNSFDAQYQTVAGERRQVELPDGSVIELNSRTVLSVHFESARRSVELSQGEAMFSVHHDTSRPFVVSAGAGQVTVTGTRFDVRHDNDLTQVAVESGSVKVQGREQPNLKAVMLSAGLGSRIDAQGQVAPAYAVNTANLTAWRKGKLVFDNTPLSEVAQEVSRYRDKPLRVAPDKTADLRVSSVFDSDDTDALLRALPGILPVSVRTLPDGSEEIFSR